MRRNFFSLVSLAIVLYIGMCSGECWPKQHGHAARVCIPSWLPHSNQATCSAICSGDGRSGGYCGNDFKCYCTGCTWDDGRRRRRRSLRFADN